MGGQYRSSLGSSDLNAHYTSDTIFYSDGSNSGIVIDNVVTKEDGSVSFDVEFPVLSADSYWLRKGRASMGSLLRLLPGIRQETACIWLVL